MIIGIDLGTTNSLACYFEEGKQEKIISEMISVQKFERSSDET